MATNSDTVDKTMISLDERAEYAARLLGFIASEVSYVANLRNEMTDDFVSFVRSAKTGPDQQSGNKAMTMSLQRNDLAAQIDQHILSLLGFTTQLLNGNQSEDASSMDEMIREVASSWTLGDFRIRFSKAFGIDFSVGNRDVQQNAASDEVELF